MNAEHDSTPHAVPTADVATAEAAGPAERTADRGARLVDRPRPERAPLIPRRTVIFAAAALGVFLLLVAGAIFYLATLRVTVPDLAGLTEGVARTRLARVGLEISTVERRFDPLPAGTVLSQDPPPDTVVTRGGGVALVVSAGTEEFPMPDVVGMSVNVARAQLEQRGLVVRIEPVPSDLPVDTVLETLPAPGATVRTSDIVRVRIAAESTASDALLPYRLQDTLFVLDPSPGLPGEVDASFEVTRRLRSLLEASGASVVVLRSVNETELASAVRTERAAEVTATVTALIGIDAMTQPPGGFAVVSIEGVPEGGPTLRLIDEVATILAEGDRPVVKAVLGSDPVLDAVEAPGVRVRVGSYAVPEDLAAFRDPTWSDTVARALYRALGERFGAP